MAFRPPAPKAGASASSATSAYRLGIIHASPVHVFCPYPCWLPKDERARPFHVEPGGAFLGKREPFTGRVVRRLVPRSAFILCRSAGFPPYLFPDLLRISRSLACCSGLSLFFIRTSNVTCARLISRSN